MNRRRKDKSQENRIKNQTNETQLINNRISMINNNGFSLSYSIFILYHFLHNSEIYLPETIPKEIAGESCRGGGGRVDRCSKDYSPSLLYELL